MGGISQYLLSVVAAATVSGIAVSLFGKKGLCASVVKLIAGLYLVMTVISPWTKLRFDNISSYLTDMQSDAAMIVDDGEQMAADAAAAIIKEQVEAYILDKAHSMDLDIELEVTFADEDPLVPSAITIWGAASPYARQQLQKMISEDIGIPKEKQSWM